MRTGFGAVLLLAMTMASSALADPSASTVTRCWYCRTSGEACAGAAPGWSMCQGHLYFFAPSADGGPSKAQFTFRHGRVLRLPKTPRDVPMPPPPEPAQPPAPVASPPR